MKKIVLILILFMSSDLYAQSFPFLGAWALVQQRCVQEGQTLSVDLHPQYKGTELQFFPDNQYRIEWDYRGCTVAATGSFQATKINERDWSVKMIKRTSTDCHLIGLSVSTIQGQDQNPFTYWTEPKEQGKKEVEYLIEQEPVEIYEELITTCPKGTRIHNVYKRSQPKTS